MRYLGALPTFVKEAWCWPVPVEYLQEESSITSGCRTYQPFISSPSSEPSLGSPSSIAADGPVNRRRTIRRPRRSMQPSLLSSEESLHKLQQLSLGARF